MRRAAAALPVPRAGALTFNMVRHDNRIGLHSVSFETQGEILTVRVSVDARVTLLSIPVARYRLRLVETWHGGTLVSIVGQTDKNGKQAWVNAQRAEEGMVVRGTGTVRYIAPAGTMGITYWNRHMMDGPMIDAESGELQHPMIALFRAQTIRLASGEEIAADHYNLSGDVKADVWYDRSDTWAGLAFDLVDGSRLHYERL